jgi:Ca2+-binding EF-hand superfamily protein
MGNLSPLSPEEKAKMEKDLRAEFDKLDTNKSGFLDKNEFKALVDKAAENWDGKPRSEQVIDDLFNEFDKDKSGKISFEEVMKEWESFSFLVGLSDFK